MIKVIGGALVGVFIGALLFEVVRRENPELVQAIESNAKVVTDRLFENMREAYDFRQIDG